jgi:hypothetical protein
VATKPRETDFWIEKHDREKGLEPLGKDILPGQRGRREEEKSLPDARAVSLILKEGIGLKSEVGPRQGATEELDEEGEHGAFDPASGKHHPVKTGLRISRRQPLPIEGPAEGNGATLAGGNHQLATSDL